MKTSLVILGATLLLGACTTASRYDRAVAAYDPVYCYQSIGAVTCHEKPNFRDERRMVNFFGPAPQQYARPAPPPEVALHPVRPFPEGYQKTAAATPSTEQPAPPAQPLAPVAAEEVDAPNP